MTKIRYQPHYLPTWRDPAESNGWLGVGTRRAAGERGEYARSDRRLYFFDRDYNILGSVEFLYDKNLGPPLLLAMDAPDEDFDTIIRDGEDNLIGRAKCINAPHIPEAIALWRQYSENDNAAL